MNEIFFHSKKTVIKIARKKMDGKIAQNRGIITIRQIRKKMRIEKKNEMDKILKTYRKIQTTKNKVQINENNAWKKTWEKVFCEAKMYVQSRKKYKIEKSK